MDKKNIGKNIQTLRSECGMTQAELARSFGVSPDYIIHLENGSRSMSLDILMEMCKPLEATPNDILTGEYPSGSTEIDAVPLTTAQESDQPYQDTEVDDFALLECIRHFLTNKKHMQGLSFND